jgi:hypothetical protein
MAGMEARDREGSPKPRPGPAGSWSVEGHLQNRICSGEVPRASRTSRRYLLVARTSPEPLQNLEFQIQHTLVSPCPPEAVISELAIILFSPLCQ